MLRTCCNAILNCKISAPVQYQTLRWKRKPRKPFWLGTAKSKIFRVHEPRALPLEESKELHRLHCNYKTAMKTIRTHFASSESSQMDAMEAKEQLASAEQIEASFKVNEEWNAACAKIREERIALADLEHQEQVSSVIAKKEAQQSELQQRVEELIRIEKEKSKDFITRENLDKKIDECLATSTDYNYAIDLKGNIYTGYESEMKASEGKESTQQQNVN